MSNVPPDFFKMFWICVGGGFAGIGAVLGVALALQKMFFDKFVTRDELKTVMLEGEKKTSELVAENRHMIRNELNAINLQWTNRFDAMSIALAAHGAKLERILGRLEGEHDLKSKDAT